MDYRGLLRPRLFTHPAGPLSARWQLLLLPYASNSYRSTLDIICYEGLSNDVFSNRGHSSGGPPHVHAVAAVARVQPLPPQLGMDLQCCVPLRSLDPSVLAYQPEGALPGTALYAGLRTLPGDN